MSSRLSDKWYNSMDYIQYKDKKKWDRRKEICEKVTGMKNRSTIILQSPLQTEQKLRLLFLLTFQIQTHLSLKAFICMPYGVYKFSMCGQTNDWYILLEFTRQQILLT